MKLSSFLKVTTTSILLSSLYACGGGDSSSSAATTSPTLTNGTTYSGAAVAGDLARLKITVTGNTETLDYDLKGFYFPNGVKSTGFGGTNPSITLQKITGIAAPFRVVPTIGNNAYFLFSNSVGLAIVSATSNLGSTRFTIIGLKNPSTTISDLSGKTFTYFDYTQQTFNGNTIYPSTISDVTFNANNTVTGNVNGTPFTGCWAPSQQQGATYYNVLIGSNVTSTTCNTVIESLSNGGITGATYYRVMVRPSTSRNAIVVDKADGTGFGFGLEKKNMAIPTGITHWDEALLYFGSNAGEADHVMLDPTNYSTNGYLNVTSTVYNCPSSTSCSLTNQSVIYHLYPNQKCANASATSPTGNMNPYPGLACAVRQQPDISGKYAQFNVLLDDASNIYFANGQISTGQTTWINYIGAKVQ